METIDICYNAVIAKHQGGDTCAYGEVIPMFLGLNIARCDIFGSKLFEIIPGGVTSIGG